MNAVATPPAGSQRTFTADLTSGLVVFLVALPLCLGVALASDAPLFAGILAGIVGGLVVGPLSGSHTSVAGPAAGLTAVVATLIGKFGSFEGFLVAVVLAGVIQVVLGVARAGAIAHFIPSSVIKGLLAAIGLILIFKQIPHLLGHDSDPSGEMSFEQPDGENTISELLRTAGDIHLGAALIGLSSLALLHYWGKLVNGKRFAVPAPLVVVLAGAGLSLVLEAIGSGFGLKANQFVQVPVADGPSGFIELLQLPDFRQISHPALISATITLALVASLETLLNLEAVDKIDPRKRVSPPNRELIAQGAGNIAAGLIGGLPVTSVIVRSSVNIDAGGKTKLATIIHGGLLLLSVAVVPTLLNRIPLACLAAILIATGMKLASRKLFRDMWQQGRGMFVPFAATVVMILLTDLLVGVLIGLGIAVAFILRRSQKQPLYQIVEKHLSGELLRVELPSQVSFLNRLALSTLLDKIPSNSRVLLDARRTHYVDPDVLSLLLEYQNDIAPARNVTFSSLGLKRQYAEIENRVQLVDYSTRELQERISSDQVLELLKAGNDRFCRGVPILRDTVQLRVSTADTQHPLAVVFGGTSSRTPIEAVFDVGLGDISCVRTTGNWCGEAVLGSLEYSVAVGGVKLLVVLGHTRNVALRRAIEAHVGNVEVEGLSNSAYARSLIEGLQRSISEDVVRRWASATASQRSDLVDEVSRSHVLRTIETLLDSSALIAERVARQRIKIVGCMYEVQTGRAEFFDGPARLDGTPRETAAATSLVSEP
ncbi:MAG TPA: SulP family inorganic anion transporter [Polyangiaceae bacterium]